MTEEIFTSPSGELELQRVPEPMKAPLRAWDRADLLLVELLDGDHGGFAAIGPDDSLLIVGDGFGALSCALRSHDPVVVMESAAGREALARNLEANGLDALTPVSILDLGDGDGADMRFDRVVLKIPKSIAELRDVLFRIRPFLAPDARLVAAAMDKHIPESVEQVLTEVIGPTTRCLATGRARHFETTFDPALKAGKNPWPTSWRAYGATLMNHGGGFSPSAIDAGTNFLLRTVENFAGHMDGVPQGSPMRIVDLGCGNGIVGLSAAVDVAAEFGPTEVIAVDDSALAIDATKRSWKATGVGSQIVLTAHHTYRLAQVVDEASVHMVVVNPPFHVDTTIGDETAWSMFVDAHRVLVDGGLMIVVGNRHLAYHAKLAKIFGEADVMGANNRFVVHQARRSSRALS